MKQALLKKGQKFVPSKRDSCETDGNRGRIVRLQEITDFQKLELLPTIKFNLLSGVQMSLPIKVEKIARYKRSSVVEHDIICLIDASKSSSQYIDTLRIILMELFKNFLSPSSKLGLITIENDQSKVLFSPTTNRKRVFGKFRDLKIGGFSYIDSAFELALRQVTKIRKREKNNKLMILAITDCFPEPIPVGVKDIWEYESYQKIRSIARSISRTNTPIIVIDPTSYQYKISEKSPGRRLSKYITSITNGKYINIPMKLSSKAKMKESTRILNELLNEAGQTPAKGLEFQHKINGAI